MSVRKRRDGNYETWLADYCDISGKRRVKSFATEKEAQRFHAVVKVIGSGLVSGVNRHKPIEFNAPALGRLRGQVARGAIADALLAAYPDLTPTTDSVIMHVIAEMPPSHVIADVDNILKPLLDALKGIAWVDDTQVCELLIRRVRSQKRQLRIKIWHLPVPTLSPVLSAIAALGYPISAATPLSLEG